MPTYTDTVNNVNYTYNVGTPTASALAVSTSTITGNITILSKFTVNSVEYIVTSIATSGFKNASNMTSITIPASITTIGNSAFWNEINTGNLTSVTFENTVENPSQLKTIEYHAFMNTRITTLTIPKSVTTLGANCFHSCNKLTSVTFENNIQLTEIVGGLFAGCVLLPSIVIPNSVTVINDYAFVNCPFLTSVTFPVNPLFKTIASNAFNGCSLLTSIVIPETVTTLGASCFNGCNLSSITIPSSVTTGGGGVFSNNNNVKTIVINSPVYINLNNLGCDLQWVESVTYNAAGQIPADAFSGRTRLKSVIFGPAITSIGYNAFRSASGLTSITIPASVTSIGAQAFYNENNTGNLTSVTFENTVEKPSQLKTIGDAAFQNTRITSLTIPKSITTLGTSCFNSCNKLTSVTFEENSQLTVIGPYVFVSCVLLPSIVLPNSVTIINTWAFGGCSTLSSVTFPVNPLFKTIDGSAFRQCPLLTSIVIPETVTTLRDSCFRECNLGSITIPSSVTTGEGNVFSGNNNVKTIVINSPVYINLNNLGCDLQWVESVTYNAAGQIPADAFSGRTRLKSVIFGSAITSIGSQAFKNASGLTSIIISASVTTIGNQAFYNETNTGNLTSLTIENTLEKPSQLKTIGDNAFQNTRITSLTIPKSITTLGTSCFLGCNKITSLTFEENSQLTVIGPYVFHNCVLLPSIVLPNSVTIINTWAFGGCSTLSSVTFPVNPLFKTIDGSAFRQCPLLTSIVIPETVTTLRDSCFLSCNLGSITIPSSVTTGEGNVFSGNNNVKTIVINSPVYINLNNLGCDLQWVESVTYNAAGQIPADAFSGRTRLKSVIFGPAITSIGSQAFKNASGLTSIIISASVTTIGNQAFYNETNTGNLTSLTIENTVEKPSQLKTIGDATFQNTRITSITIPKSVTTLGTSCFNTCNKLTSVTFEENSQLTIIGAFVFHYCVLLPSIVFPNSVTTIGFNSFSYCSALASITFPVNPLFKTIVDDAFRECRLLTSITIPETVTNLGNSCFQNCNLSSITIPSSVTTVGGGVFSDNNNVKTIVINSPVYINTFNLGCDLQWVESVTYNAAGQIPADAFRGRTRLKSVIFGPAITSIGLSAFYNTYGLTSITIPASVTSIGTQAFYNQYNIGNLTSLTFENTVEKPSQLKTIGDNAFQNTRITSLTIPKSITTLGSSCFNSCNKLTSVTFEENSQLTQITTGLFAGCVLLPSIVIPNSVTSIGGWAFSGCKALTSIPIPISVNTIGERAFESCNLSSITILSSVKRMDYVPFNDNNNVKTIVINSSLALDVRGLGCDLGPVESVTYNAAGGIPDSFSGRANLKSVIIGPAITSIGELAFYNASGLTSITIPASVTSIGREAFYNQNNTGNLTSLTIENTVENPSQLKTIGNAAFQNTKITSITIPKSVTSMGDAFRSCPQLASVTFEDNSKLTDCVLAGNTSLTSIVIPDLVTNVNFYNCTRLSSVTFPINPLITTIGGWAFANCRALTSITIPSSVNTIGERAFESCNLSSITIPSSVTRMDYIPFNDNNNVKTIVINSSLALDVRGLGCELGPVESVTYNAVGGIPDSFSGRANLKSVRIGPEITSIGTNAFLNATNLIHVSFERNSKLTTIGSGAFKNTPLTSIEIPGSVSRIYNDTFAMPSLKKVFFSNKIPQVIESNNFTNPLYTIYVLEDTPRQDTLTSVFKNVIEIPEFLMDFATSVVPPNLDFAAPEVPSILSVVGANNKITVTFTQENSSPVPVVNYSYSIDNGQTFKVFNPKQKSSPLTISGLINGQTYSVSIKAYNGYYSDATTAVSNVLVNYPQPAPIIDTQSTIASGENGKTNLYFSQPTNNGNTISNYWLSINGGEFNQINLSQVLSGQTQDTKYIQLQGLTNGQTYSFMLKANNTLTTEPMYSETASVNNVFINYPQPAPVINTATTFAETNKGYISFTQETNSSRNIVSYFYSTNGTTWTDLGSANKTSPLIINNLTNGETYSFTIKAYNGLSTDPMYSPVSNTVTGIFVNYPQPAPIIDTQSTIASGKYGEANLYFSQATNNANAISSYWLSINGATFKDLGQSNKTSPITISNLVNGLTYSFGLKSANGLTTDPFYSETATVTDVFINYPQPVPVITSIIGLNGKATINFTQDINSNLKTITNYLVSIDDGITYNEFNKEPTSSSIVINNLQNGNSYQISIKSFNGLASAATTSENIFINYPQPAPVITSAKGRNNTATIYFDQTINTSKPITSYLLSINGGEFIDLGFTNKKNPLLIRNLINGSTYSFSIKAFNGLESDVSNTISNILIMVSQPFPTVTSTFGENGVGYINFTQQINPLVPIASSYLYSTDGINYIDLGPTNKTTPLRINNLTNGSTYSLSFKSYNEIDSDPSPPTNDIFINYPQLAPVINTVTTYGENNKAYINFTQPTNNANSVVSYFYSTNGISWTDLGPSNKTSPLVISNLTNGQSYSLSIKAYNGLTTEPMYSPVSNTATDVFINYPKPAPVVNTLTTFAENNKAYVYFTQPTNNSTDVVSYSYSTDGNIWTDLGSANKTSPLVISNLTNGQTYSFTIKAYNGLTSEPMYSLNSNTVTGVFVNYPQLSPVINEQLTIARSENNKAYIHFTQPKNNANDIISYFYSKDGINWSDLGPTNKTSPLVISDLVNGQTYSLSIKSFNGLSSDPLYSNTSTVNNVFINYPQLAPVINTTTTFGENNKAYINFTQPTNNANSVVSYFYSTNGTTWTDLGTTNKKSPLVISNLTNGQTYSFTLKAYNGLSTDPMYSINSNTVTGVFINYPQLAPKILSVKTINGVATVYWSQTNKNNSKNVTKYYYSNGVNINYFPIDKITNPLQLPPQPANTKLNITLKGFNGLTTEPMLSDASNAWSLTQTVVQGALSPPTINNAAV